MRKERAIAVRRLAAFGVDWIVVVLWGVALFAIVMLITGGASPRPANPWIGQGIGLLTMTMPVILYFAICESSEIRASLGKWALGLVVSRETGERLSFGSALVRNALKFIPWEFGHMVAQQAAYSGEGGFPAWVWVPTAVAFLGPVWWIVGLFATGRTPYDRWVLAQVSRLTDPGHGSTTIA